MGEHALTENKGRELFLDELTSDMVEEQYLKNQRMSWAFFLMTFERPTFMAPQKEGTRTILKPILTLEEYEEAQDEYNDFSKKVIDKYGDLPFYKDGRQAEACKRFNEESSVLLDEFYKIFIEKYELNVQRIIDKYGGSLDDLIKTDYEKYKMFNREFREMYDNLVREASIEAKKQFPHAHKEGSDA